MPKDLPDFDKGGEPDPGDWEPADVDPHYSDSGGHLKRGMANHPEQADAKWAASERKRRGKGRGSKARS